MIPRTIVPAQRITGGVRVKGKWIPGGATPLPDIKTTIQVVEPNVMQTLPEGRRTTQSWIIYSDILLQTELEGEDEPDEVTIEGQLCIVLSRGAWQNSLRNHRAYIVQRKTSK